MDLPPPYQEHSPCASTLKKSPKPHGKARIPFDGDIKTPRLSTSLQPAPLISNRDNDRKVWLCPHVGMDFDEAKQLFSNVPLSGTPCPLPKIMRCRRKVCKSNLANNLRRYPSKHGRLSNELLSMVTLFWAPKSSEPQSTYGNIFSVDKIATGLHGLDFPICTHLRLNQAFI
jgi:hypothetical protein